MRTETRTVNIGEWLGPVDWSYDFEAQGNTSSDPDRNKKAAAMLREVEDGLNRGERWMVYAYGTEREVLRVGMYDGWPHWKPTPTYLTKTWLGGEEMGWYSPVSVRRLEKEEFGDR